MVHVSSNHMGTKGLSSVDFLLFLECSICNQQWILTCEVCL